MKSVSTDHCDKGVSISKNNKELKTSPIYIPVPQKGNMIYTGLLVGLKGTVSIYWKQPRVSITLQ